MTACFRWMDVTWLGFGGFEVLFFWFFFGKGGLVLHNLLPEIIFFLKLSTMVVSETCLLALFCCQ